MLWDLHQILFDVSVYVVVLEICTLRKEVTIVAPLLYSALLSDRVCGAFALVQNVKAVL